jgi:hypothetical protein
MKNKVGLWIDNRSAILVYIAENEIGIKTIKSKIEKQSGVDEKLAPLAPLESNLVPKNDVQHRIVEDLMERFYEKIYSGVKNAESVLIFGPGDTKGELKTYIENKYTGKLIIGVETVDRMSDNQIIAKVSKYFKNTIIPPAVIQ